MRPTIAAAYCTIAFGGLFAGAGAAWAHAILYHASPPAGSTVHISGSIPVKKCPASDGATITGESALFPPDGFGPTATRDSQGTFAIDYTVPTSTPAGSYSLGLRCGGGNVGVSTSLTVTAAPVGGPATGAGGAASHSTGVWTALGVVCLLLAACLLVARGLARRPS